MDGGDRNGGRLRAVRAAAGALVGWTTNLHYQQMANRGLAALSE